MPAAHGCGVVGALHPESIQHDMRRGVLGSGKPAMKWTIYAPVGSFASVEAAAAGEQSLDWTVREGADHAACTLCYAAVEIAEALRTSRRHTVLLQGWQPDQAAPAGPSIVLMTSALLAAAGPAARGRLEAVFQPLRTPPTDQSFALRSNLGRYAKGPAGTPLPPPADTNTPDFAPQMLILGGGRAGALYGAYELLEQIHVKWLGPDACDAEIDLAIRRETLDLHIDQSPSFVLRGYWVFSDRGGNRFVQWMARNRLNLWSIGAKDIPYARKLGMLFQSGIHDEIRKYLPTERHFAAHPEWYSLRGGQRSNNVADGAGDNFCMSNAAARAEFARAMVEDLATGKEKFSDYFAVVASDGGHWCECAACVACGTPTDLLMLLVHDCRQAVRQAFAAGRLNRDVQIGTTAYLETKLPPTRPLPADFDHAGTFVTFFPIERCYAHTFAAPECTELNVPLCRDYEGWANPHCYFQGVKIVGEYYNVSKFAGMAIPFHRTMAADVPYYHATGARGMHYMHVTVADWGTLGLTNRQFAAQLWNAGLDPEAFFQTYLRDRYGDLAYGSRQTHLTAFYEHLEAALRTIQQLKHIPVLDQGKNHLFHTLRIPGNPAHPVRYFRSRHLQLYGSRVTTDSGPSLQESIRRIDLARNELEWLEQLCADPLVRERLAADARRFHFTRHMLYFYWHLARLRECENRGDRAGGEVEAQALCKVGEALRAEDRVTRNGCQDSEVLFRNGLYATWLAPVYVQVLREYGITVAPVEDDGVR